MNKAILMTVLLSGGAFTPLSLTGLSAWWDFSDLSTLDVSEDGAGIGAVTDKSGSGNNLSQSDADLKPLLKLNISNGRSVARFDNTNDALTLSSMALSTAHSAFAVIIPRGSLTADMVIANGSGMYLIYFSSTNMYYYANGAGVNAARGTLTVGTVYLMELIRNGTAVQMFKNGTQLGTDLTLAANNNLNITRVGTYSADNNFVMDGDIAEIIIYNRNLLPTERAAVENYLDVKWGF